MKMKRRRRKRRKKTMSEEFGCSLCHLFV